MTNSLEVSLSAQTNQQRTQTKLEEKKSSLVFALFKSKPNKKRIRKKKHRIEQQTKPKLYK